jgi:hypothetical protein
VARKRRRRLDCRLVAQPMRQGQGGSYGVSCIFVEFWLHVSIFPPHSPLSLSLAAPTPDSCIDIRHLTEQLQRARGMGASIIVAAFAAGMLFPFTSPSPSSPSSCNYQRQT